MDLEHGVVSVDEVAPGLYSGDGDDTEDVVDDLEYDVYNMVASDNHSLHVTGDVDDAILAAATRATQLLVNRFILRRLALCFLALLTM